MIRPFFAGTTWDGRTWAGRNAFVILVLVIAARFKSPSRQLWLMRDSGARRRRKTRRFGDEQRPAVGQEEEPVSSGPLSAAVPPARKRSMTASPARLPSVGFGTRTALNKERPK